VQPFGLGLVHAPVTSTPLSLSRFHHYMDLLNLPAMFATGEKDPHSAHAQCTYRTTCLGHTRPTKACTSRASCAYLPLCAPLLSVDVCSVRLHLRLRPSAERYGPLRPAAPRTGSLAPEDRCRQTRTTRAHRDLRLNSGKSQHTRASARTLQDASTVPRSQACPGWPFLWGAHWATSSAFAGSASPATFTVL
jgi:hypothetical protein